MTVLHQTIKKETRGYCDIIDITDEVRQFQKESGLANGLINISIPGSTCGLTTIEYEPGAVADLKKAIERLVPQTSDYAHNNTWGDGNGFSHVRAALLGSSLTVSIQDSDLILGTWQQIVLVDFDNHPRQRTIHFTISGE